MPAFVITFTYHVEAISLLDATDQINSSTLVEKTIRPLASAAKRAAHSPAYLDGNQTSGEGGPATDNPYVYGSENARNWYEGYCAGRLPAPIGG